MEFETDQQCLYGVRDECLFKADEDGGWTYVAEDGAVYVSAVCEDAEDRLKDF